MVQTNSPCPQETSATHPALTGNYGFVGIQELRVHPGQSHVQIRQVHHRCCDLVRSISDAHRGQQAVVHEARSCLYVPQAPERQQRGNNNNIGVESINKYKLVQAYPKFIKYPMFMPFWEINPEMRHTCFMNPCQPVTAFVSPFFDRCLLGYLGLAPNIPAKINT